MSTLAIKLGANGRLTQLFQANPLQWLVLLGLLGAIALPLLAILSKSTQNEQGEFIGLANFIEYFGSATLNASLLNSLFLGVVVTTIVVVLAFIYAYALTHTRMPAKGAFRFLAMLPLLAPSLLSAISLVYLFGNQGILKDWLMGHSIYGPIGVVIGSVFWIFPHAFMILYTALSRCDARLYESALALKSSNLRTFINVTLPNARYGLVSASLVSFTLVITDFGVPKVIGGQFNVLATDIYKQVVGLQNFQMGAVVSVVLLFPVVLTFFAERWVEKKQKASLNSKSVIYEPKAKPTRDLAGVVAVLPILAAMLLIIGMAVYASFVSYWPYNLSLSLNNYQFDLMDGGGWQSYYNSLQMALYVALFGTVFIWISAFLGEKTSGGKGLLGNVIHTLALVPMAVPGMVLGLAYIFFFNSPTNPANGLYGTMAILVMVTIAHFYTVCHLTFLTSLKQLDPEFEAAADSLKVSTFRRFVTVTTPLCAPAILEVFCYLFINAMTTVSAVVFLYSTDTMLASVAVLNMDDAGDLAPAAAMAVLIMLTCAAVRGVYWVLSGPVLNRLQPWRVKS